MPDNVGYTPGSGATVAADDVGGVLHQRVKLSVGADGVAADVTPTNGLPIEIIAEGEIAEQIEAIRYYLQILSSSIGSAYPDGIGRLRVVLDGTNNISTVTSVNTVSTVSTVNAVTQLNQLGSYTTDPFYFATLNDPAIQLRRNITVT